MLLDTVAVSVYERPSEYGSAEPATTLELDMRPLSAWRHDDGVRQGGATIVRHEFCMKPVSES